MGTTLKGMAITEAQAAKLQVRAQALAVASARMTDALDMLGLPLDRPVNLLTDAGPDENGMIRVQWKVPDAPPAPAPPKPPKSRRRKKD